MDHGSQSSCFRLVSEQRKTEEVGILGFGRARNETSAKEWNFYLRHFHSCSSFFAPKPRGNAYCAGYRRDVWLFFHYHYVSVGDLSDKQVQEKVPTERNTY